MAGGNTNVEKGGGRDGLDAGLLFAVARRKGRGKGEERRGKGGSLPWLSGWWGLGLRGMEKYWYTYRRYRRLDGNRGRTIR